ncbi:MAG TPA: DUF2894 domain-containing protein [Rhodocyclaceae bacterium]|nr:DUF2894 domain-containing protein [Rhodocyclaceae bacterium]
MSEAAAHPLVQSLRERGADRLDPIRFRFIEALARRAGDQQGNTRHLLEGRLANAVREYGERFEKAQGRAGESAPEAGEPSPLAELLTHIARQSSEAAQTASAEPLPVEITPVRTELKAVSQFRETWSKLSLDQRLAEALASGPENAGPLNSHLLVLQSLKVMRNMAPDYLNRFIAYVDALVWLEQAQGMNAPAAKGAPRSEGGKKRAAGRSKSA